MTKIGVQVKIKLLQLHKKQNDLVTELKKRGYRIKACELSNILSGRVETPKADLVLSEVQKILKGWEGK